MPERRQIRVSGGLEARSERPAMRHGEPGAGLGSLRPKPYPHWFILSRGVPAPTSSGCSRAAAAAPASSGVSVTAMLL